MTQIKDMPLSLKSDTFSSLTSDFDSMLRRLLEGMVDTGEGAGTINIKVKVSLTEDSAPDYTVAGGQQTREITKPKFEHEVSAVIQRKDKRSGSLSGNFELVRDGDGYVMRPIDDGQYTLFDGENGEKDRIYDAECGDAEGGPRALPGAPVDAEEEGGAEDTPEDGETAQDASVKFKDTPFGWLSQFIGETLRVTEAMGNYTVRNRDNKVILSSAASPDADFYCPAEKLENHVGHKVVCVAYGGDEVVNISIECEDCGEVLFDIDRLEESEDEAGEDQPSDGAGDGEDGDYPYEAPSEEGEGTDDTEETDGEGEEA